MALRLGWHPDAGKRLVVENETRWSTTAIRSVVVRCLRHLGMRVRGHVRVVYSTSKRELRDHNGRAALGHQHKRPDGSYWTAPGLNMSLSLPRDPARLNLAHFCRVILHEALHWKGVDHKDMTPDQLWCRGPLPAWAEGAPPLVHRDVKPMKPKPTREEIAERKLEAMRARVAKLAGQLARTEKLLKKWRRKLRDAERRTERRREQMALVAAGEENLSEMMTEMLRGDEARRAFNAGDPWEFEPDVDPMPTSLGKGSS